MGVVWAVLSIFTLGSDLCHENDVTNNQVDSCDLCTVRSQGVPSRLIEFWRRRYNGIYGVHV